MRSCGFAMAASCRAHSKEKARERVASLVEKKTAVWCRTPSLGSLLRMTCPRLLRKSCCKIAVPRDVCTNDETYVSFCMYVCMCACTRNMYFHVYHVLQNEILLCEYLRMYLLICRYTCIFADKYFPAYIDNCTYSCIYLIIIKSSVLVGFIICV